MESGSWDSCAENENWKMGVDETIYSILTCTAYCHTILRDNIIRSTVIPMAQTNTDARLNFRLKSEFKKTIEDAAAQTGQTVSDFAISTLIHASRQVLHDQQMTQLSQRDRQAFVEMLDDETTKPNAALVKAAKRYKKQVG